jgi:UDP-N-acetylmuramyl pentapeptide phosphotransferase/UDP-N-acetylglucosamine-1-phosphate transferase
MGTVDVAVLVAVDAAVLVAVDAAVLVVVLVVVLVAVLVMLTVSRLHRTRHPSARVMTAPHHHPLGAVLVAVLATSTLAPTLHRHSSLRPP